MELLNAWAQMRELPSFLWRLGVCFFPVMPIDKMRAMGFKLTKLACIHTGAKATVTLGQFTL